MIKSLTPFYINVPFVNADTGITCQKYTLKIYVWDGDKDDAPTTATYEITKFNPTESTETDKINIARLVNDFIDFQCTPVTVTQLIDGDNQKWVQTEIYYDDLTTPSEQTIQLLLRGYGYGMSGENPQPPTNKILIPIQDYKVNREGVFVVPILVDEPTPTEAEVVITLVTEEATDEYEITFTSTVTIPKFSVFFRTTGSLVWEVLDPQTVGTTSPFTYIPSTGLTGGDYEFMLVFFYTLTGETIYSNIYNLVV
jgi:hypothetical protein